MEEKKLTREEEVKSLIDTMEKLFGFKPRQGMLKQMQKLSPDELRAIINENVLEQMSKGLLDTITKDKKASTKKSVIDDGKRWEIGAVVPFSEFKYVSCDDEEFRKCFALTNLRPVWSKK